MDMRIVRRGAAFAAVAALGLLTACSDGTGPGGGGGGPVTARSVIVLNSTDRSLTVIPEAETGATRTIGLGPQGSPVTLAARGQYVAVPMGTYPFVVVVDLVSGTVARTIPLPAGSGATGVAFVNDSIAVVANPGLNSVTPVNVLRGTAGAQVPVGVYPQAVVQVGGATFVLNANLVNFAPAGPGSVSVLNTRQQVVSTIALTGTNPGAAAVTGNTLYVLNAGRFGQNEGSLSVVPLTTEQESRRETGFGDFPGGLALSPTGELYVSVYGTGVLVWNPAARLFTRGLNNPILPGGAPPTSGLGFDSTGRVWALNPGTCDAPGKAYRLLPSGPVEREVTTGICPFAVVATSYTVILPGDD